jgi:hypothetical protein
MYRRKRRILTSLVLGFAVAAFAAPSAIAEPRGPGNTPRHTDFWNYDPATGENVANTSPRVSSDELAGVYSSSGVSVGSGIGKVQLDPLIADAIRAHHLAIANSSDARSLYGGDSLSPAVRGELVKTMQRPSAAPVSAPTTTISDDKGFQWVDVGLGAASTLGLVLLVGTTALVIRHQRRRLAAY